MSNSTPASRLWRAIAALFGLSAVALAAIAAHALPDVKAAQAVERAAIMQLVHAVLLLYMTGLTGILCRLARWSTLVGITLFCGGIYAKYLLGIASAGSVAPIGGMTMMLGWLLLGLSSITKDN
jgi:uncharacterized membrane protein YgdD (TMEM256/DUF423 family)